MAFAVALLAGVMSVLVLPALPPRWLLVSIGACAGFALAARIGIAIASQARGGFLLDRTSWSLVGCGLAVGFLHAAAQAHLYLNDRWPANRSDARVIATVVIDTIPAAQGSNRSFDGIVTIESPTPATNPLRVRLLSRSPTFKPHAGERWRLLLSLRPPRARVNPGTQDMERVLFRDRVHALGTVIDSSLNRRIDSGHRPLSALRERIAAHIDARVVDRDAAALISALAVGVTGAMSREQWRVFNATGTTHLVAISGLHVTLFAVVAFACARALWSALFYRVVPWPRETFAAVVGFVAAAAYATLAGLSVPTQRTLLMLGVWLFTRAIARASPPFHSFALALVAVLLLDPFAPLAPGFWLSFGAMAAIILVTSTRFARRPLLLEALAVQTTVTVALVPLTLASFGAVSLIGPIVNTLAIPAMSWLFVPTILLAMVLAAVVPVASDTVLHVAAWFHEVGWPWLAAAADVPWALVHANPPLWWYGIATAGMCLSLLPFPRAVRLAACIWTFPLAASIASPPLEGSAELTFLDTGEGTAIVVQTARHTLLLGTGDGYGTEGRNAETVVIPFLRGHGVRQVDALVIGRLSAANSSGLTALLAELAPRETWVTGDSPPDLAGARRCGPATAWHWDGVTFRMLPGDGCALAIEAGTARALLPGDLDAVRERDLVAATNVSAHLVLVPRHGSAAASSQDFIRAVGARWAVVPGRRERAGREKPAIARWHASGTTVLATGDLGAIRVRLDPVAGIETPVGARAGRTLWRGSP